MNFIAWLAVGVVVGVIASFVLGTDARQSALLNIVIGVVGAVFAGLVVAPAVGAPADNTGIWSFGALLVPTVFTVLLLIAVNLVRRTRKTKR